MGPNVSLQWTRDGPQKNHDIFSAPYRPPNTLFHILVSPFLLFGPISFVYHLDSWNLGKIGFSVWCTMISRKRSLRWTLEGIWVCLKKTVFFQELKNTQKLVPVVLPAEHEFGNKYSYDIKLRVYRSIFTKISTLPVDLEIGQIRVCWRQEHG